MSVACTLLISLSLFSTPDTGARAQVGEQAAAYRIQLPKGSRAFPGYTNNGYVQKVSQEGEQTLVEVMVKNGQLSSKVKGRRVSGFPKHLADLENQLNQAAEGYLADQIMILFSWLRTNIHYDTTGDDRQDIARVITQKRGNCVGFANLSIHILSKLGVQARSVTGLAWKQQDKRKRILEGEVLHRWIEVYYDDVGWVFCDPAGKVNFVEATYLLLGVEDVHPISHYKKDVLGGSVELLSFKNGLRTVARIPKSDKRLRVRPNRLFVP